MFSLLIEHLINISHYFCPHFSIRMWNASRPFHCYLEWQFFIRCTNVVLSNSELILFSLFCSHDSVPYYTTFLSRCQLPPLSPCLRPYPFLALCFPQYILLMALFAFTLLMNFENPSLIVTTQTPLIYNYYLMLRRSTLYSLSFQPPFYNFIRTRVTTLPWLPNDFSIFLSFLSPLFVASIASYTHIPRNPAIPPLSP